MNNWLAHELTGIKFHGKLKKKNENGDLERRGTRSFWIIMRKRCQFGEIISIKLLELRMINSYFAGNKCFHG